MNRRMHRCINVCILGRIIEIGQDIGKLRKETKYLISKVVFFVVMFSNIICCIVKQTTVVYRHIFVGNWFVLISL